MLLAVAAVAAAQRNPRDEKAIQEAAGAADVRVRAIEIFGESLHPFRVALQPK